MAPNSHPVHRLEWNCTRRSWPSVDSATSNFTVISATRCPEHTRNNKEKHQTLSPLTAHEVKSREFSPTKHAMLIKEVWTILMTQEGVRIWRIVLPLEERKIGGKHTRKFKHRNSGTPWANPQILIVDPAWSSPQTLEILYKSPKGYTAVGCLYSEIAQNTVLCLTPHPCTYGCES